MQNDETINSCRFNSRNAHQLWNEAEALYTLDYVHEAITLRYKILTRGLTDLSNYFPERFNPKADEKEEA